MSIEDKVFATFESQDNYWLLIENGHIFYSRTPCYSNQLTLFEVINNLIQYFDDDYELAPF